MMELSIPALTKGIVKAGEWDVKLRSMPAACEHRQSIAQLWLEGGNAVSG